MRTVVLLSFVFLSACGSSSSSSASDGVDIGASPSADGATRDAVGDEIAVDAGAPATSCADHVADGAPCSGSFSCDRGSVSCCVGGVIQTGPLYVCQCRDGVVGCYPTDYCWGVPYACVDDAGADADAERDAPTD